VWEAGRDRRRQGGSKVWRVTGWETGRKETRGRETGRETGERETGRETGGRAKEREGAIISDRQIHTDMHGNILCYTTQAPS